MLPLSLQAMHGLQARLSTQELLLRLVEDYYPLPSNPEGDRSPVASPPPPSRPQPPHPVHHQNSLPSVDSSAMGVGLKRKRGRPCKDGSVSSAGKASTKGGPVSPAGKARTKKSVKASKLPAAEAQAVPGQCLVCLPNSEHCPHSLLS